LKLKLLGVLAVLSLALFAGCGDDDKSSDSNTGANTTTTDTTTTGGGGAESVDVSLTDFKIDPKDPEIAKAGTVEFKVKNDGQTEHNLEVEGPSGEKELPSNLDPGQSGTLTVDLSKPGKYEWYCPVANHRDLGMEGEITVGSGGSTTTGETNTDTTETTEAESGGNSGSGGGSGSGY
jgi:uncharacterized cupredoxin-like copper-binding protein